MLVLAFDTVTPAVTVALHEAEPIYLRRPDVRVPGPPKRVTVP